MIDNGRITFDLAFDINNRLSSIEHLQQLLDSLPGPCFIVTPTRQVVLSNDEFRKLAGTDDEMEILGNRPGDVMRCIYAKKGPHGCGTSSDCKFCKALDTMLEVQRVKEKTSKEARLIIDKDGHETNMDLSITVSPLKISKDDFYLISLQDITSEKRRRVMERVFFHDVLNLVHGLRSYLEMTEFNGAGKQVETSLAGGKRISDSLMNELVYHKKLLSAEAGDLEPEITSMSTAELLLEVSELMSSSKDSSGRTITMEDGSEDLEIATDRILLKRILINMVKNALEASEKGKEVRMGSFPEGDHVVFTVWNEGMISEAVRSQIWQRSFSTKGNDRGLGTYSMKLFAEEYLKGSIEFTSERGSGTTFSVRIPMRP